jgi:hypothetical protein
MSGQLALRVGDENGVLVAAAVWEKLPTDSRRRVTIRLARLLARLIEDARDA